jgi:hypothetical protein
MRKSQHVKHVPTSQQTKALCSNITVCSRQHQKAGNKQTNKQKNKHTHTHTHTHMQTHTHSAHLKK